jgi:hypothetical protein
LVNPFSSLPALIRRKGLRGDLEEAATLDDATNEVDRPFVSTRFTDGDTGAGIRIELLAPDR